MNETLAAILARRLSLLGDSFPACTFAGLVRTLETDQLSGVDNKPLTLPVPIQQDLTSPDDWKLLLPDPKKSLLIFFEDGSYTERLIGGLTQGTSRLTLVAWFNANLLTGITWDKLTYGLLNQLVSTGRRIPSDVDQVPALSLSNWSKSQTDPFAKYSAYAHLFDYKEPPYGYLALDLSLTAYITRFCLTS